MIIFSSAVSNNVGVEAESFLLIFISVSMRQSGLTIAIFAIVNFIIFETDIWSWKLGTLMIEIFGDRRQQTMVCVCDRKIDLKNEKCCLND